MGIFDRILSTGRSRVPRFGYRPDPTDDRDRMLASLELVSDVPLSATVVKRPFTIKNQNGTGSCVGQSVAQAVQFAFARDDAMVQDLSALFVYYNSRKESGDDTVTDNGTYLRTAIKSVQKFGVCPELVWPFSSSKVNRMPTWNAYRTAHDRRGVRGYYRIEPGNLLDVKRAIASGRPVVAGWQVDAAFKAHRGGTVIGAQQEPFVGGHAMVVIGYTAANWDIVNSWGTGWGDHGLAIVNDSFMRQARDLWAVDV